jgi:hypothetical protein
MILTQKFNVIPLIKILLKILECGAMELVGLSRHEMLKL